MSKTTETPPIHQWTNSGDRVLIVKQVAPDGSSHGGFKWERKQAQKRLYANV